MNLRLVSAILGYLTLACGAAMLPPLLLAGFLNESAAASFLLSMLLCLGVAFELERYGAVTDQDNLSVREGIAITGLGWLLVSLLGMFPYFTGGYLNLLDSIVESVSGFSGTGATVIEDVEILPKSILLWRSLSNWVGGLGIIVIFMASCRLRGAGRSICSGRRAPARPMSVRCPTSGTMPRHCFGSMWYLPQSAPSLIGFAVFRRSLPSITR